MNQNLYKIFFLNFLLVFSFFNLNAQVLKIGPGTYVGSNVPGPLNTSINTKSASRYAYIYPASLVTALKHGDSVLSFSFFKDGGGPLSGNANLKIYVRTTVNANYGIGNVNWVNLTTTTGMKKVYDRNPLSEIDSSVGWKRFKFDTPFVVDTVIGKNLEILVEYVQADTQMSNTFWTFENGFTVPGFTNNQTKYFRSFNGILRDTTNGSTDIHPTIRIEFPRYNFEISVSKLYSLGKLPVPLGNPDTLRAIVQNVGKKDTSFKLYIKSKGANVLIDSQMYFLKSLEEKLVKLPLLYPSNTGLDTLEVVSENDAILSDNIARSYRIATEYIYSYKDPSLPLAGGIGFNGSTGDFVAKFYSSAPKVINQLSVNFSGTNQKFKLGVWAADGNKGQPGTLVWLSDTLNPAPSFITSVDPPVNVNGNFYVGVRQIGTINVGFGYQSETPVRSNTFYFAAPQGDTNWVDFAPDAPFKFLIEPRIQAPNDVAPLSYDFPSDTIWLTNSQVFAPKATFINYGSNDQSTPLNVSMRIQRYGSQALYSTRQITLNSGQKKQITFDSAFYPTSAGEYDVMIITALGNDNLKDNDTLKSKIIVAAFKDVGPGTIFDPSSGYDYEQFVDTVFPTVFLQNYGLDNQGPFNVRAEIYDSTGTLIYWDNKPQSLTSLNSVLVGFKPFPCDNLGRFYFRAFSELNIDVDKSNDTVSRFFNVIRSNDVSITKAVYPQNGKSYPPPVAARQPEVILENFGDANQGLGFNNYCEIYFNNTLIYRDSVNRQSFRTIPEYLLFKPFQPTLKGYYTMKSYASLDVDQYRANDTLYSAFAVGVPDDVELISIHPAPGSELELNRKYASKVTLRNNGYNPQNTPFPVVFKVSKGGSLQYVKIINVTIDSGETKTFDLDSNLILNELTQHEVSVYSLLSTDFVKSNDSLNGLYLTNKSNDIGVARILYPTETDTLLANTQNVLPIVQVVNYGDSLFASRFKTIVKIRNANNSVVLYNKSIDSLFSDSGSLYLQFPGINLSNPTDLVIEAYTESIEDQFALNDTARSKSYFRIMFDPQAEVLLTPVNLAKYTEKSSEFLPEVRLKNNGLGLVPEFFSVLLMSHIDTITSVKTEVYRDTIWVSDLGNNETKNYTLNLTFDPENKTFGKYICEYNIISFSDQIFNNNALSTVFYISPHVGINRVYNVNFNLYPNPVIGNLTVEANVNDSVQMQIVDVHGKLLKTFYLTNQKAEIDTDDLASGVYFVKSIYGAIKFVVE